MGDYETRTMAVCIQKRGVAVYSEGVTEVKIDDEGGGEFVVVTQCDDRVAIDPEEWPLLCDTISKMISQCRPIGDEPCDE